MTKARCLKIICSQIIQKKRKNKYKKKLQKHEINFYHNPYAVSQYFSCAEFFFSVSICIIKKYMLIQILACT